jgi:hypothetical protein
MGRPSIYRPLFMTLMSDGVARSSREIEDAIGCGNKFVRVILNQLIADGLAHIESYRGRHHEVFYRLGAGENAPMPVFKTAKTERSRRWVANRKLTDSVEQDQRSRDRALDEKYRAAGAWWPRADSVVVGAMVAMVRSGRVSA